MIGFEGGPQVLIIENDGRVITRWDRALQYLPTFFISDTNQAKEIFTHYGADMQIIVVGDCVSGNTLNTLPLIRWIMARGYKGHLIAALDSAEHRTLMLEAGCTESCSKDTVPNRVRALLR